MEPGKLRWRQVFSLGPSLLIGEKNEYIYPEPGHSGSTPRLHAASGEVHGQHHGSGGQAPQKEVHCSVLAVRPSVQALYQGIVGECFN